MSDSQFHKDLINGVRGLLYNDDYHKKITNRIIFVRFFMRCAPILKKSILLRTNKDPNFISSLVKVLLVTLLRIMSKKLNPDANIVFSYPNPLRNTIQTKLKDCLTFSDLV